MADLKISEWKCSYYDLTRKKWVNGILQLTKSRIRVLTRPPKKKNGEENSAPAVYMTLSLDNITDIRKANSGYVFKCVVVTAKESQHWFSSLPVRDNVYNVLTHFWRNRFMPTPEKRHSFPSHTKRGAELLRLVQDPEQSLLEAGEMLIRQGEELDYSLGIKFDMVENFSVGDKPRSSLEEWFGKWRVPKEYLNEGIEFVNSKGIPIVHEFPILFYKGDCNLTPEKEAKLVQTPGIARVSNKGISILTEGQVPCHHYAPKDVSVVKILTPWKIMIARYRIDEPAISYVITSSHMVKMIRVLEVQYKKRFNIEEVPENVEQTFRMSGQNRESLHEELMNAGAVFTHSRISPDESLDISAIPIEEPEDDSYDQMEKECVMSSKEADEMCEMLSRVRPDDDDLEMDSIDDLIPPANHNSARNKRRRLKRMVTE